MVENSKATYDSDLNWYRLNLTKRKELSAFRNIIIDNVNAFNKRVDDQLNENGKIHVDSNIRQYLLPSNSNDVDGYYESIMNNIKFSCWIKCTDTELKSILNELSVNEIAADASRKSNSGTIRVMNESEVNTLRWIINNTPKNLFRANSIPSDVKPATLSVSGNVVIEGGISKMRGKVDTDKFFFTVLDTKLFMVINKGTADEAVDLSQELENAKKAKANEKTNKERHWMVLRASHGSEQYLEDKINRWKEANEESDIQIDTYLPMYVKDLKKDDKIVGQRKALFCPGYLFIHTSISELLRIETDKLWDGFAISRRLVRESMRKKDGGSVALTIRDEDMNNFKFAADSNLGNIALDSDDYMDNEYVRYFNPGNAFNQLVGRVLHKKGDLYLTFLPVGLMAVTKAIKIESAQIRKLTSKEKAELKIRD